MIICVCNNISDKKIRQAVDAGMTSMAELRENLELGTCCGKCHSCAKKVLQECLGGSSHTPLHAHRHAQAVVFTRNALAV